MRIGALQLLRTSCISRRRKESSNSAKTRNISLIHAATRIMVLAAFIMTFIGYNGVASYADSGTEGTGSGATADVSGNISFSVPTETILGITSGIAQGGGSFITPSNWITTNTGDYPISVTDISSSNEQANLKTTSLGAQSSEKLASANGYTQDALSWSVNSGFNNKTYTQAGGQLVIPSKKSIIWNWFGGITLANMSDDFRLDLANGQAKLCDVTFTYRAIKPLNGTITIERNNNLLVASLTDTNIGGASYCTWYILNKDGSKEYISASHMSTTDNEARLHGKTIICEITDPSYWTTGTLTSEPYYFPDQFAIYSDDDNSLIFYDRGGVPSVGDTFNGRKVTVIYTGLTMDKLSFDSKDNQPWANERDLIHTVSFTDEYIPTGTGHWFEGCKNLKSIDCMNLSFGKATFATGMFDGCSSLTDINAEMLDTSSLMNANNMFRGCTSLFSIDVSDWNVSKLWNTGSMFQNCTALESLNLSKWDTKAFIISYSMFQNCKMLETIGDTTNWNLSNLSNPTYMFTDCQSLKYLNTQNWSMKSADDLQFIFDNCFTLENIDVSKWDVSNVTNIEWLFNKCYEMTSIDVSSWNVSKVTNMQGAFANTASLSTLDVSKWDVSNATDLSYMFNHASSLKAIGVDKWNVSKCKTLELTFMGCTALIDLNISQWKVDNCTSLNYTFGECPNIETIDISQWNVANNEIFYRTFYLDSALKVLDISKWTNSVATNWIDFAKGCENVKELDMSGIDNSNAGKLCGGVFIDMYRLEKITFGNTYYFTTRDAWPGEPDSTYIDGADGKWYAESTGIGYSHESIPACKAETYYSSKKNANVPKAFAIYSADDSSLDFYKRSTIPALNSIFNGKTVTNVYTDIETFDEYPDTIPWITDHQMNIKTSTVIDNYIQPVSINKWFYLASSMIQCNLSKLDTSRTVNMATAFSGCSSLSTLDVSTFNTSNVTDMNGMFAGCSKIVKIVGLDNFDTSNVVDMDNMFIRCSSLTALDGLDKWNTSNVTDMGYMFSFCTSLKELNGLGSWNVSKVTRMTRMFDSNATSSLDILDWDVSNVADMTSMFSSCINLSLDCSKWNAVKSINNHDGFNNESPNVIAPSCWES